jgi:hypothetical protein
MESENSLPYFQEPTTGSHPEPVESSQVFWIMTPCSVVVGYQRFGGPCCLHLQGKLYKSSHPISSRGNGKQEG